MLVADGNENLTVFPKDDNREVTSFEAKQYDNVALLTPYLSRIEHRIPKRAHPLN